MPLEKSEPAPFPRLCHIKRWTDYKGYGFGVQTMSSVDTYVRRHVIVGLQRDSPAEMAGLREGDRIVAINGINVCNENHSQVMQRLKSIPNAIKLLVADEWVDKWYETKNIVITDKHYNVLHCETPIPRPKPLDFSDTTNGFCVYKFRKIKSP